MHLPSHMCVDLHLKGGTFYVSDVAILNYARKSKYTLAKKKQYSSSVVIFGIFQIPASYWYKCACATVFRHPGTVDYAVISFSSDTFRV